MKRTKDQSETLVKLAKIESKLDHLVELFEKHDSRLTAHDDRLRHVEKTVGVAYGWAGAVGFVVSVAWSFIWDKLAGR